jgi:hypothetical protein
MRLLTVLFAFEGLLLILLWVRASRSDDRGRRGRGGETS